jgi:uncharacterized protein YegL
MKEKFCAITFVIDESGSMSSRKKDVIGSFNEFAEAQKNLSEGDLITSLYTFNNDVKKIWSNQPKDELKSITERDYNPSGSTALFDALGKAINETGDELSKMEEEDKPSKVLFVIITDGEENSSSEFTLSQIKEMIEHQESVYNWSFIYLGDDLSKCTDGHTMGIKHLAAYGDNTGSTLHYACDVATKYRSSMSVADADLYMEQSLENIG